MREILFRAKRLDNGEWVEGGYFKRHNLFNKEQHLILEETERGFAYIQVDPETVCQLTGLNDKNGVKIFEGDIVKQTFEKSYRMEWGWEEIEGFEIGVVGIVPSRGACLKRPIQTSWINGEENIVAEKTNTYKNVAQYRCEVIGNIFDNPELMEGGVSNES